MNDSLLSRHVRGSAMRMIILNGLLVLMVAGIFAITFRYYRNYFSGPYEMPRAELLTLNDADDADRYFVTISGDDAFETGYQEITETKSKTGRVISEKVSANYYLLQVDDYLLMVKAPGAELNLETTLTGSLVDMPSDLNREFMADLRANYPDDADAIADLILPMMLDAGGFRTGGTIGLVIMLPLLALGGFNLVRGFARLSDPQKHPALRALSSKGSLAEISYHIEQELRGPGVVTVGGTTITPSWVIARAGTKLDVINMNDVAWIYRNVTQRRVNGVPTGKVHAAAIHARPDTALTIQGNEATVQQILTEIGARAPWALMGYNDMVEKDWKKNRPAVLAAVDQRRAQLAAGQQQF